MKGRMNAEHHVGCWLKTVVRIKLLTYPRCTSILLQLIRYRIPSLPISYYMSCYQHAWEQRYWRLSLSVLSGCNCASTSNCASLLDWRSILRFHRWRFSNHRCFTTMSEAHIIAIFSPKPNKVNELRDEYESIVSTNCQESYISHYRETSSHSNQTAIVTSLSD